MAGAETILMTYGVVRGGHIQRSFLVTETANAYMFQCTQGKHEWG